MLCFSYIIPTDNRFYMCKIDVILTDNSFLHAEVTSPNTLPSSLISFVMVELSSQICIIKQSMVRFLHGLSFVLSASAFGLRNMHNKTIIEFGFRMLAIIIKASVCVIRLSLRLQQITQTLALIIIANMLNRIQ